MLTSYFVKIVAEYETKDFQHGFVNIFGNSKFTSICFLDKDLVYAITKNETYQLCLQRVGLGIYAEASLVTKAPSKRLSSIYCLRNHFFLLIETGILK